MTDMTIRGEAAHDRAAITRVVYAAFLHHPQHAPGALPTEHKIVEALRASGALTLSLVCEERGEIVGHVAFSPVWIEGHLRGWYSLGPVAVRPDRQRAGIGSALIRAGIRQMQEHGAAGFVLVGDPRYYQRFGFAARPELLLENVPAQYFLCLAITGDVPAGRVTFPDAFTVS